MSKLTGVLDFGNIGRDDQSEKTGWAVAGCLAMILLIPFTIMWSGAALMWSWNWLVVPQWDMRPLTLLNAVTARFIVGIFTYHLKNDDSSKNTSETVVKAIL